MSLLRTPFYEQHRAAGARLIDFGGWELPVQFSGIMEEHRQVRDSVGLFDVSHMGEIRVRGPDALSAVRRLVTNDVNIEVGQAQYTLMCTPEGGIVDDLIVYRLADKDLLLCVNAARRAADWEWITAHNPSPETAVTIDEGDEWAQIAVQGRHAPAILDGLTDADLQGTPRFGVAACTLAGVSGCLAARTGYTGEDGFEVFIPAAQAPGVWDAVMTAGAPHGIRPIGLGARDTLRLEAKMCLYGNDITLETTPLEAGLRWAVKLDKPGGFIGDEALRRQKAERPRRRLVCLVVEKRIARHGHPILVDGAEIGVVTSGTRSPSLGTNIALGYVPLPLSRPGSSVQVSVRGRLADARVVRAPFYKRPY